MVLGNETESELEESKKPHLMTEKQKEKKIATKMFLDCNIKV